MKQLGSYWEPYLSGDLRAYLACTGIILSWTLATTLTIINNNKNNNVVLKKAGHVSEFAVLCKEAKKTCLTHFSQHSYSFLEATPSASCIPSAFPHSREERKVASFEIGRVGLVEKHPSRPTTFNDFVLHKQQPIYWDIVIQKPPVFGPHFGVLCANVIRKTSEDFITSRCAERNTLTHQTCRPFSVSQNHFLLRPILLEMFTAVDDGGVQWNLCCFGHSKNKTGNVCTT